MITGWQPQDSQYRPVGKPVRGPYPTVNRKRERDLGRQRLSNPGETLETWGTKNNPIRLGLTGDRPTFTSIPKTLRELASNPHVAKQFSALAHCVWCRRLKIRTKQMVNGRKLCLRHAWMEQEGLLGVIVETKNGVTTTRLAR